MNATAVLTRRQAEVTELIAWGATKKDVANILNRSTRTIENTIRSVYERTGVTKVNELSAWYFCTHYCIPLTMSPLVRRTMACVLLAIFSMALNVESKNLFIRVRRVEELYARARRSEHHYLISA